MVRPKLLFCHIHHVSRPSICLIYLQLSQSFKSTSAQPAPRLDQPICILHPPRVTWYSQDFVLLTWALKVHIIYNASCWNVRKFPRVLISSHGSFVCRFCVLDMKVPLSSIWSPWIILDFKYPFKNRLLKLHCVGIYGFMFRELYRDGIKFFWAIFIIKQCRELDEGIKSR